MTLPLPPRFEEEMLTDDEADAMDSIDPPSKERTKVTVNGREVDADAAVALMDDGIREELHGSRDWASEQEFIDACCREHKARFGEDFAAN